MAASILKVIQLVLFAAFAAAPIGWILVYGPAQPYEQRAQTGMPDPMLTIAPEGEAREQLADAIFERSDLRRMAISTKNTLMFEALGFADADEVVSGAPGWLFYKPEIASWTCPQLDANRRDIEAVVMLGEIAAAAHLPFVLAIAPNKASVERDAVQGRAALLLDCYFETADYLERRLAEANLPSILHHTPLVRALGKTGDTYFRTDTHWLPVTGFLAAGDLMRRFGRPGFPASFPGNLPLEPRAKPRATDLRRMLLISPDETSPVPDLSSEPALSAIAANRIDGPKTLIVHDSFYAQIGGTLEAMIGNAQLLHIEDNRRQVPEALADTERLIVSTVERALLSRVRSDSYIGWLSPIGRWVTDGADIAADQCQWDQAVDLQASSLSAPENPPQGRDGQIPIYPSVEFTAPAFAGASSCLRVEIETSLPDVAHVFFETADAEHRYLEQRAVRREIGAGMQRIQLVVPASAIGKRIGVGSGASSDNFRIVSIKAAPAPAQFAPVAVRSKPIVSTAAALHPQRAVLAEPGRLNTFLVVEKLGDTGKIRPDGAAYEARSISTERAPVGDGDGVLTRLDGPTARLFSGRRVQVEVTARASPERGSTRLRVMYSRSGAPESSGWQELSLTNEFSTQTFVYTVPLAPPASFDIIAIWADPTGKNLGVDISSIIVKTIDDTEPAP